MSKSAEFIKHVSSANGSFITDIWFHPGDNTYRSVVTDLYDEYFTTLEEIEASILKFYGGDK